VGQVLTIRQGSLSDPLPQNTGLYTVKSGDTSLSIAARFGLQFRQIHALNPWFFPDTRLWVGQQIIIPKHTEAGAFIELPAPIIDLSISPLPLLQGQTLRLVYRTAEPVESQASFMGIPLHLANPEPNIYVAMVGIHAFTESGIYPLNLTLRTGDGKILDYHLRVSIGAGDFGSEFIVVDDLSKAYLFEPTLVQTELDKILSTTSAFTPTRYFTGFFAIPTTGIITSPFGTRRTYNDDPSLSFHGGVDFAADEGSFIIACADGIVVLAESLQVRGNAILLDHGWGVYSGYWHLSQMNVTVGQSVKKGDVIGLMGNTGLSIGAHLHWELWVNGIQVDPMQWTQQAFFE
jgi:murein DD-endopeptidase MepM/ murein hydrolase activator NlpD